jgi:hypothetical protein
MIIQNYNDLCLEIEGLELRIDDIHTSIKYNQDLLHGNCPKEMKGMTYSDMPKGSANYTSIDRIFETISKLESHLYLAEENLKSKRKSKKDIEGVMARLEGVENKVFYLNRIKGIPLIKVAEEIGYSVRQTERISGEISKLCKEEAV